MSPFHRADHADTNARCAVVGCQQRCPSNLTSAPNGTLPPCLEPAEAADIPAEPNLCDKCRITFTPAVVSLDTARPRQFPQCPELSCLAELRAGRDVMQGKMLDAMVNGEDVEADEWHHLDNLTAWRMRTSRNFNDWGKKDRERLWTEKLSWNQTGISREERARRRNMWRDTNVGKSCLLYYIRAMYEMGF